MQHWFDGAIEKLQEGQGGKVWPKGNSMRGHIREGDAVLVEPCATEALSIDDIVLVKIQGRRYFHIVLHSILECNENQFLIGTPCGRIDGWVNSDAIFGKVVAIEAGDGESYVVL